MPTSEKPSLGVVAISWVPSVAYGVLLHLLVVLVGSLAIGFTHPSSRLRYVALIAQTTILYFMNASWGASLGWNFAASFLAQHTVSSILQYFLTAILSQWSYQHGGPAKPTSYLPKTHRQSFAEQSKASNEADTATLKPGANADDANQSQTPVQFKRSGLGAVFDRLAFGYNAMQAYRMLNTPYEARNSPSFSRSSPDYVPGKTTFLLKTFARFAVSYLILDAMAPGSSSSSPTNDLMSPSRIPIFRRLSEVTLAELGARAGVTVAAFIAGQATVGSIYCALALLSVGTGCSSPVDWRPLYGSVRDAYTIRKFWNSTWHQLSRLKYIAVGHLVTYACFRCKPNGMIGRYVFVAVVFMVSGIHHFWGDRAEGVTWLGSGNFTFFTTQVLGIMLEDQVQKLWSRFGGKSDGIAVKALGYIWVFCFMAWSIPVMIYTSMAARADVEPSPMVPWSILQYAQNLRNGTSPGVEL